MTQPPYSNTPPSLIDAATTFRHRSGTGRIRWHCVLEDLVDAMSDQQRVDAAVTYALHAATEEWWHVEGETGWTTGLPSMVDPRHADLVRDIPDGPQAVYVRHFKPYDTPCAIEALGNARQVLSVEPTYATAWVEQAEVLATLLYLHLHPNG